MNINILICSIKIFKDNYYSMLSFELHNIIMSYLIDIQTQLNIFHISKTYEENIKIVNIYISNSLLIRKFFRQKIFTI